MTRNAKCGQYGKVFEVLTRLNCETAAFALAMGAVGTTYDTLTWRHRLCLAHKAIMETTQQARSTMTPLAKQAMLGNDDEGKQEFQKLWSRLLANVDYLSLLFIKASILWDKFPIISLQDDTKINLGLSDWSTDLLPYPPKFSKNEILRFPDNYPEEFRISSSTFKSYMEALLQIVNINYWEIEPDAPPREDYSLVDQESHVKMLSRGTLKRHKKMACIIAMVAVIAISVAVAITVKYA